MYQKNSSDNETLHFFVLGREWRLSVAELSAVFGAGRLRGSDSHVAVFSDLTDEEVIARFPSLGGSIFAGRLERGYVLPKKFDPSIVAELIAERHTGRSDKVLFSLAYYPEPADVFERSLSVKKRLRKLVGEGVAIRSINAEKDGNPTAVPIRKQGVLDKGHAVVEVCLEGEYRLGVVIAAQDVDAYARRDTDRVRDMKVGMLPPKLAQIMLNMAGMTDRVYDPFCGLGTVLMEATERGATAYGSDAADAMVRASRENLANMGQDASVDTRIFRLDAARVAEIGERVPAGTPIVTEGTLGPILSQSTISRMRVAEIDGELAKLYDKFFAGLKSLGWQGKIVVSFPCFRIERADVSAVRCVESFTRHGFAIDSPLPERLREPNRRGILYRRPDQTVGREIFVLVLPR